MHTGKQINNRVLATALALGGALRGAEIAAFAAGGMRAFGALFFRV